MQASIQIIGRELFCRAPGSSPEELRRDGGEAETRLNDWAARYARAVEQGDDTSLLTIGRELFAWLDANGWASAWARGQGPRALEIQVEDADTALGKALLAAPWELLGGPDGSHLAGDQNQRYDLARRLGRAATAPPAPRHSNLRMMFMAADPEGAQSLDYEGEEAAILKATDKLQVHLLVEETGTAQELGQRMQREGDYEVLHLSCHGTIDQQQRPLLALEDEVGGLALTPAGTLIQALGGAERIPLIFLSACLSARRPTEHDPLTQAFIRAGVANVLGWDGSVNDQDAIRFARAFYAQLANYGSVVQAAAHARAKLIAAQDSDAHNGRHWHLARVYLGATGGTALIDKTGSAHPRIQAGDRAFLDPEREQIPVAGRGLFVGRRRQLQKGLRHLREEASACLLIHGMGCLGKSSLAARIANRMTEHATCVIFKHYDALTVFDRLIEKTPPVDRQALRTQWRSAVTEQPEILGDALEALLEGPLDTQPVLLIIDDLERILDAPSPEQPLTPVSADHRAMLGAVLGAFARARTASRLLLTSRYCFTLPDDRGRNLAERLERIALQPFDSAQTHKQRAALARHSTLDHKRLEQTQPHQQRAETFAQGNPGLLADLLRPLLAGKTAVAKAALNAIAHYHRTGERPEDEDENALLAFFHRMAFETYREALSEEQAHMLSAATLFDADLRLPIPLSAFIAVGKAADISEPEHAFTRLCNLGLISDWGHIDGSPQGAVDPLARPLVRAPCDEIRPHLAAAALDALFPCWSDRRGRVSPGPRALELARLARLTPDTPPERLDPIAEAAARWLLATAQETPESVFSDLLQPALQRLEDAQFTPSIGLMTIALDYAIRLSEGDWLDQTLERFADRYTGVDAACIQVHLGRRAQTKGTHDEALACFKLAAKNFEAAGQEREATIAKGQIADILQARGNLDDALRIRTEEEIPVYERLGDVRSKAVTQGKIADIIQARGNLDEALRIRTEEEIPVYERLGDVREKAVTQSKIADILQARGNLDEALRIRTEEQLPVYERLGDVRSKAVTQSKIADILQARGNLDEALRILTEEVLQAFERLGDVREKAVTQGKIADILQARGNLDEALRILTEEVLQAFERLGDVREKAVTQG
ncbi:CHAT domain-containing protein, partial [Marichromatium gracile]|uniref:CHAT domain-containing protein n=1 Tax=Marichromatium gracile TaxID=1048 RepID=UPI001F424D8D